MTLGIVVVAESGIVGSDKGNGGRSIAGGGGISGLTNCTVVVSSTPESIGLAGRSPEVKSGVAVGVVDDERRGRAGLAKRLPDD